LASRLTQLKVTNQSEAVRLQVFELQQGDLVVTDRANGLRECIVWVKDCSLRFGLIIQVLGDLIAEAHDLTLDRTCILSGRFARPTCLLLCQGQDFSGNSK
jgi:hypothetical protein